MRTCAYSLAVECPDGEAIEDSRINLKFKFIGTVLRHENWWAISSLVERCPDKTEVEGPIPSSPTNFHRTDSNEK